MNCEEDKDRFQKGVEKDLIALSEESIPVNTRQKAMWAYRLYEKWAQWRKDAYDPRVDFSTVGDLLMVHTELAGVPDHDVNELLCQLMKKCMTELLQIIDSFNSRKGHCFTQVEHEVII